MIFIVLIAKKKASIYNMEDRKELGLHLNPCFTPFEVYEF